MGGASIEIQNDNAYENGDATEAKLVFTNCTFNNNWTTGSGGAFDIRSLSYVKIDGITATMNGCLGG